MFGGVLNTILRPWQRFSGPSSSPWDSTWILEYGGQFGDQKCYIPKFWKFYVQYEFRCYHLWFSYVWSAFYTEHHGTCPFLKKMYKLSWTNNLFYGTVMKSMLLKNKLNWGKNLVKTLKLENWNFIVFFYRPEMSNCSYFRKIFLNF